MRCLDSRRLTGPNLLWDEAGAVLDVQFGDLAADEIIDTWARQVRRMMHALGWRDDRTCIRRFARGASLAIAAPFDALYAATDINDWAWEASARILLDGEPEPDLELAASRLREDIARESNPRMMALRAAARARGLPVLVDTDELSIGLGIGSECWALSELPAADGVPWERLHCIPVALVTGTNGKTTSVRLAASVARSAGYAVGISSTDWIEIDGEVIDRSDWAGPGGARAVLRDTRTELAVLETARGGMLRRGLAVERADAALITNVAADHLGEFGVENVNELAEVKWIVTRALKDTGYRVLNADDEHLVARGEYGDARTIWFSLDSTNPTIEAHVAGGGTACTVIDEQVVIVRGARSKVLIPVDDMPLSLGGIALHNVANALGVSGLCLALGLPENAIAEGLRRTGTEANPGRGNVFDLNGATVVVDFAHNPHGLSALLAGLSNIQATRRLLVIGQAGDRSDDDIRELVRVAHPEEFDRIIVKHTNRYSRGRSDGEVAEIIKDELARLGVPAARVTEHEGELDAAKDAIAWARPGDVLALLTHEDRDAVLAYVSNAAGC